MFTFSFFFLPFSGRAFWREKIRERERQRERKRKKKKRVVEGERRRRRRRRRGERGSCSKSTKVL